jgi:hypothetical protein
MVTFRASLMDVYEMTVESGKHWSLYGDNAPLSGHISGINLCLTSKEKNRTNVARHVW